VYHVGGKSKHKKLSVFGPSYPLLFFVGVPKVQVTRAMQHLQQITESGAEVDEEAESHKLNYSTENNPLSWIPESDLSDKYHFISEISR